MKLLYVIQRYGDQIVGGSESACRHFAEWLVARGHEVDVLTSCAHDYVDWADEYPAGIEIINGVTIHRFPVVEPRKDKLFAHCADYKLELTDVQLEGKKRMPVRDFINGMQSLT